MQIQTRLREIRTKREIPAADLARRVGISRQTIYAIEEGAFVPNTAVALELARALEVTVEEIFSPLNESRVEPIQAISLTGERMTKEQLVRACRVNRQIVGVPVSFLPAYLPAADGIVASQSKGRVSITSSTDLPEEGKRLLLAGCDPALSLLNDSLRSTSSGSLRSTEIDIVSVSCSSRRALAWLKEGKVHAAGSHLLDPLTGEYNLPIVRRLFPASGIRVVSFATWELGLVLQSGNPKSIRSIADLARKDVSLINREKGSGSRDLLDTSLRRLGISSKRINGYASLAEGHLAAAFAVASGHADCCIAPRSAARCFGLNFVPLAVQRFDLSFTRAGIETPAAKALLDLLNRGHLRNKLQSIAGYDTAHTGELLM